MHIPDGYLSPATCAAFYAGSAPFWWVSLRGLKKSLNTRLVPLVSLFAAFAFVIMMFNIPLPGGTTGHALGVTVAAIVLGPWTSILAVSTALVIQAVFFGDGGITAIGANCFNMAIVGSLVAYGVYCAVAAGAEIGSRRRVFAAGIAGYTAINVAALCAAVEFGIQPALFHDGTGAPLYAPYPLHVAIPAMMIGHLTIAGFAEAMLSAGIVAYLQRTRPALLNHRLASQGSSQGGVVSRSLKPLWAGLAALLILSPLGILAAGTAWGEWSASDFASHEGRQQIASSSRNQQPPAKVPDGLQRLSSIWTAPFPDYAPSMIRNEGFGYMLSGMFGAGLTIASVLLLGRFGKRKKASKINVICEIDSTVSDHNGG